MNRKVGEVNVDGTYSFKCAIIICEKQIKGRAQNLTDPQFRCPHCNDATYQVKGGTIFKAPKPTGNSIGTISLVSANGYAINLSMR